jgi:hypothetical protein
MRYEATNGLAYETMVSGLTNENVEVGLPHSMIQCFF